MRLELNDKILKTARRKGTRRQLEGVYNYIIKFIMTKLYLFLTKYYFEPNTKLKLNVSDKLFIYVYKKCRKFLSRQILFRNNA